MGYFSSVEISGNEVGEKGVVLLQQNFHLIPAKASQRKTDAVSGAHFPGYILFVRDALLLGRGLQPLHPEASPNLEACYCGDS